MCASYALLIYPWYCRSYCQIFSDFSISSVYLFAVLLSDLARIRSKKTVLCFFNDNKKLRYDYLHQNIPVSF